MYKADTCTHTCTCTCSIAKEPQVKSASLIMVADTV